MFPRGGIEFASAAFPHLVSKPSARAACYSTGFRLSPLFPSEPKPRSGSASYDIELVDDSAWRVSSGLAIADQSTEEKALEESCLPDEVVDEPFECCSTPLENDPDFDDIDKLRVRGRLFYKIDRDFKEYEENSFDFHRRNKASKKKHNQKESTRKKDGPKESTKKHDDTKKSENKVSSLKESKRDNPIPMFSATSERQCSVVDSSRLGELDTACVQKKKLRTPPYNQLTGLDSACVEKKKKLRTPTYNQLTGPFHEPFCLDVYISKASVRACIVHRFTSKVVAVAHSISKDMKFDLGSTRNAAACAAVGEILAQRALGDDIRDVIYTPRKGERIAGKLQDVVQSLIDNGVNVKVKFKQRNRKNRTSSPAL